MFIRFLLLIFLSFAFANSAFSIVEDEFVKLNLCGKYPKPYVENGVVEDDLLKKMPPKNISKPETNLNYNYANIKFAVVPVRVSRHITSKRVKLNEEILFLTTEPVKLDNGKVIPENTAIIAKIAFLEKNRMRGYPAMLIVEGFRFTKFPEIKLDGQIVKQGFNHSIWAYPASRVLMSFGGLGFALHPIKGAHAKISPKDRFELYIWKE